MTEQKTGAVMLMIHMLDSGDLDLNVDRELLNEKTKIVSVTHVSNALGVVKPVKEIAKLAHDAGAVIVVDGAQAVPHGVVDVQELDADFYAFSAHKMCGPTGFGILYGKETLLSEMPPYRGGGGEMDKEHGEEIADRNDYVR